MAVSMAGRSDLRLRKMEEDVPTLEATASPLAAQDSDLDRLSVMTP